MLWQILFAEPFEREFAALAEDVQDAQLARAILLRQQGPRLSRPYADTLKGSRFANMKELRFQVGHGVWRVAYAFDPLRQAVLLVAADKAGIQQERFYQTLIERADSWFQHHLMSEMDKPDGKNTR